MVSIIDLAKDPYGRRFYAAHMRRKFEKFKHTAEFKSWRNIQIRAQEYQCAWCRIDLRRDDIRTHVDHVQPLYYDGKNIIDNLVLSCRRCNLRKWISNKYVYPQWIVANKVKYRLKRLRRAQQVLFDELLEQNYQEQLARRLSWTAEE